MQKQIDLEFYKELVDAIAVSEAVQNSLKIMLEEAFEKPQSFYDENGEFRLSERGLTFAKHRDLTAKFVLIDRMIGENQMAEVDWKEDEKEVRLWLSKILEVKKLGFNISAEEKYENEDTFEMLNLINVNELKPNGCCLEILDIDSDSYVFTVVPAEKQNLVAAMFAKLK